MNTQQLKHHLSQHIGGGDQYMHQLVRSVQYTEGARDFFINAGNGAYWMLDILATEPDIRAEAKRGFANVLLKVEGSRAVITVDDGNDSPPVFKRDIEFTDCPEGDWQFYFIENVILLPSEY